MEIKELGHMMLNVRDLARSEEFYRDNPRPSLYPSGPWASRRP